MLEYIVTSIKEMMDYNTALFGIMATGVCIRLAVYTVINYVFTVGKYIFKGVFSYDHR